MRRLLTLLRSPRLAVWLLVGIAAYSALAMSVPQRGLDPREAAAWRAANPTLASVTSALRLDDAFASPLFLVAMLLLFAVTAACAWSRTSSARSKIRPASDSLGIAEVLDTRPTLTIRAARTAGPDDALQRAGSALSRHGYRVRRGRRYLEASRNTWGALGSPTFHLALVALVVVIAAGTLTRSSGVLDIPEGERVIDETASYQGRVKQGRLFFGHSGLEFGVRDLETSTVVGGVDRGQSAVIDIYRGGRRVASGRVYPNSPLRYASLLIHRDPRWGYAPLLAVETPDGTEVAREYALVDQSSVSGDAAGPAHVYLSGQLSGLPGEVDLSVEIPFTGAQGPPPRQLGHKIRVGVPASVEGSATSYLLAEGESAPLPGGLRLKFVRRANFMRISVVDDWSVPFIYALFAVAAIAMVIALFAPMRRLWIAAGEDDDGPLLRALWRRAGRDPSYRERVERLLSDAVDEAPASVPQAGTMPRGSSKPPEGAAAAPARAWWSHLLWIPAGALLQFTIAAIFSGELEWPRRFFLIPYVTAAGAYIYAFFRWNRLSPFRLVRRHWRSGVIGAAILSVFGVWLVVGGARSVTLSGWRLAIDVLWSGVTYGAVDAILLSVMPVLATARALSRFAWARERWGRILVRIAGFGSSIVVTVLYHLGFTEYRGLQALGAAGGNAIFTLGYVLTGSPLAPVIAHIIMHIAAVLHGPGAAHVLPPHYGP